ncbi:MAG: hypothetical protein JXA33_15400 [Anaerolineae bacterium]|nr:hypothetical protein [Anaerolineae bacterium]
MRVVWVKSIRVIVEFEASDEDILPVDAKSHAAVMSLQLAKEAEASGLQALEKIVVVL